MTRSNTAKTFGLLAATLIAWALTVAFDLAPTILAPLADRVFETEGSSEINPVQLRNIVTLYAVFGLPIAVVFTLIVGFPVWKYWERLGRTNRRDAIRLGAIVGLVLGLALAAFTLIHGLQTMSDPNRSFNSWSYGYQTISDGMPTALGWVFQLFDVALTSVTGAAAGLTAWTVAALVDAQRRSV